MKLREYIGTVSAHTQHIIEGEVWKECRGRWVLYRFLGLRRARLIGDPGPSSFAQDVENKVRTWKAGGPLPKLDSDTQPASPAPVLRMVDGGKK